MSKEDVIFNIGDMIIPKPPLKQAIGIILQIATNKEKPDLKVMLQDTGTIVWVSSMDVELI